MMKILLYRRSLSLTSGAGQLIRAQAAALKAAGDDVRIGCRHGVLKFSLRTGLPVTRIEAGDKDAPSAAAGRFLVDHQMQYPRAGIIFVHNLAAEAQRHLPREDWAATAAREAALFRRLDAAPLVVANSRLVAAALTEHFGVPAERIVVHYPGIDAARFERRRGAPLRRRARRALGFGDAPPLVGLITSGDFAKRGLDLFLGAAETMAATRDDVRFLIVGSKRLPDWAARHPLIVTGRARYEPKGRHPERWMAALDLFLYPAHFEEFGMVVAEALAMGVPVLTSRRVGATECLPPVYAPWLLERPDSEDFAARALALLDNSDARNRLIAAGVDTAAMLDRARYADATLATIRRAAGASPVGAASSRDGR